MSKSVPGSGGGSGNQLLFIQNVHFKSARTFHFVLFCFKKIILFLHNSFHRIISSITIYLFYFFIFYLLRFILNITVLLLTCIKFMMIIIWISIYLYLEIFLIIWILFFLSRFHDISYGSVARIFFVLLWFILFCLILFIVM